MIGKAIIFSLCVGAAALTLQAEDPVDFTKNKDESPKEFSTQYRMDLVRQMQKYTFENFIADHEKSYEKGTLEYKKRAAIFHRRKTETIRLAGLSKLTWTPALNKFLDNTKDEMKARLGYKPSKGKKEKQLWRKNKQPMEDIPDSWTSAVQLNWVPNMTYSVDFQKDQGACGSCWAVATASVLEAHADVHHGISLPISAQQLVSCTPNPRHCGGAGGCDGATAELALDYASSVGGLATEQDWPYISMYGNSGTCLSEKEKNPFVLISGYISVPSNNLNALLYAVTKGPVVIAVDASPWSFYGAGIFNSCKRDATLNHAVMLVGYGLENSVGYWLIRNSWGDDWGSNGYIKLSRTLTNTQKDPPFCGMDYHPEEGSACDGETDPVKVCGMCGILYEPVLPIIEGVNKPSNFDAIIEGIRARRFQATRKLGNRLSRKINR